MDCIILFFISLGVAAGVAYGLIKKNMHIWFPYYVRRKVSAGFQRAASAPAHIMLCVVDHFEPGNGRAGREQQKRRLRTWLECYPRMADGHRDADGRPPRHTWFYPPHHDQAYLEDLAVLCRAGYGDIEMHLHHNHMPPFPDTADTLKEKIVRCLDDYSKHGIFCLPDGRRAFAFVHGDWSLDNGRGDAFCGVNNEISILRDCGCYADFTFPTVTESQPAMPNTFFYAKDDPGQPNSHKRGVEAAVGKKREGDLLLIQGILGLRWGSRKKLFLPSIEASDLDRGDEPSPGRVDYWIRNAVAVKGRPEWLFIKLHTHGAREEAWDSLFGEPADTMFSYLENRYNDGKKFVLHYVTARELYNIVRAAEAGNKGDPGRYRDFEVPAYTYQARQRVVA